MTVTPEQPKPCPFCGFAGKLCGGPREGFYVRCTGYNCPAVSITRSWTSIEKAMATWNDRPYADSQVAVYAAHAAHLAAVIEASYSTSHPPVEGQVLTFTVYEEAFSTNIVVGGFRGLFEHIEAYATEAENGEELDFHIERHDMTQAELDALPEAS